MSTKTNRVIVYLDDGERQILAQLAHAYGLSLSQTLVRLMRDEVARQQGVIPSRVSLSNNANNQDAVAVIEGLEKRIKGLSSQLGKAVKGLQTVTQKLGDEDSLIHAKLALIQLALAELATGLGQDTPPQKEIPTEGKISRADWLKKNSRR